MIKPEHIIAFLLALLIGYLLYLIMFPFLVPIFWAAALAILFYPLYKWLLGKLKGRESSSAFIACAIIALFLLIPLGIIGTMLAQEVLHLYEWAERYLAELSANTETPPQTFILSHIENYLGRYTSISARDIEEYAATTIKAASSYLAQGLTGAIKNFANFILYLVLTFFALFFFFKDGHKLVNILKDVLPIPEKDKNNVLERSRVVISATLYGGVLVGGLQGVLGGVAFWFLGLPAPVLWGFVMLLLSFLPAIGTAIIWGPAAIYLILTGSWIKGLILALWGIFIVGLADNLLRPIIVSGRTKLHPLLLFFSILGAVNVFGLIGIIAGPIIISISQATLELYQEAIKRRHTG